MINQSYFTYTNFTLQHQIIIIIIQHDLTSNTAASYPNGCMTFWAVAICQLLPCSS